VCLLLILKVQNTLANRSNPTPAGSLLPKINNRQRSQPTSDPDEEASLRLALELTQDEERLRMYNGIDRSPDPNAGRTLGKFYFTVIVARATYNCMGNCWVRARNPVG